MVTKILILKHVFVSITFVLSSSAVILEDKKDKLYKHINFRQLRRIGFISRGVFLIHTSLGVRALGIKCPHIHVQWNSEDLRNYQII